MHTRELVPLTQCNRDASFGQLHRVIVLHLDPSNNIKLERPVTLFLAAIQRAKADIANVDGMVYYKDVGDVEVVDLPSVQCVVGRVKTPSVLWGIIPSK